MEVFPEEGGEAAGITIGPGTMVVTGEGTGGRGARDIPCTLVANPGAVGEEGEA